MEPAPVVTVILPAYDAERFVAEAVRSVLAQSHAALRLVAVDDGSRDGTAGILAALAAADPRMEVVSQPNRGAGAARNAGLAKADTAHVAFIDSDDVWHPSLLAVSLARLEAEPDLLMTFPLCRYIDVDGRPTGVRSTAKKSRFSAADLMMANPIHSGSGVLVRHDAIAAAGGFDPAMRSCIDLDCWVRVAGGRPDAIGCIPEMLVDYRRRPGQITADWTGMRSGWQRTQAKAAMAGYGLKNRQMRAAQGRLSMIWAGTAYEAGDYAGARKLVRRMWQHDPMQAATDPLALIRTGSALASYLPGPLHAMIRHGFNSRR